MSTDGAKLYKLLVDGRSPHQHAAWPIPSRGKPGEWIEVAGELGRCRNGLHLTADPVAYRKAHEVKNAQCYLAETEGEVIKCYGYDEYVARKVRLVKRVPWSDFKWVDPEPEADPIEPTKSPAYQFLSHAYRHTDGSSWQRLNSTMQGALLLAVRAGIEFDPDDFGKFVADFRMGRWIGVDGMEHVYAAACGAEHNDHGGNPSAVAACEKRLGRTPFIIRADPSKKTPTRLYVGASFKWWDGERLVCLHVTSFNDADGYFVAVERKHEYDNKGYHSRTKVERVYKITHQAIKDYHKILKDRTKSKETADVG